MMLLVLAVVFCLMIDGFASGGGGDRRGSGTMLKPNIQHLRMIQDKEGIGRSFFHVDLLMRAIADNKVDLQVFESKTFDDLQYEKEAGVEGRTTGVNEDDETVLTAISLQHQLFVPFC